MGKIEEDLKVTCARQPALCKSKVIALMQFCRFAHGRTPEARSALKSAISRAAEWKLKASKEDRKREAKLQGKMSDETYLPSKEELQEYREKADGELGKFLRGERRANYTNAVHLRRILEAKICLTDFNRAGPLTNATLGEYEAIERFGDGRAVLMVQRHKSSATHGPANLPLTRDILHGLDLFVRDFRPKLNGRNSEQLFMSAKPDVDVKRLALSQGMEDLAKKLTPTMLRKVAGTTARASLPEADCERLANLMCHQPDTQRRHYAAKQRKKSNLAVAELMEIELFGREADQQPPKTATTKDSAEDEETRSPAPTSSREPRMKKRKTFGTTEMDVLMKAAEKVTMPLSMKQAESLKQDYPVLKTRATKVIYNKLRELVEASQKTRRWLKTCRM